MRFVWKNAREFGVAPDRIAVMDTSAGAHLALLVGSTMDSAEMAHGGCHLEQKNDIAEAA